MSTEINKAAPSPEINEEAPSPMEQESKDLSEILFENVMRGQWDKVVKIYKDEEESHVAVLTESEDTALHLAVSDGKPKVVKEMVGSLGGKASEILKLKNERGNTPLHTAAVLGDAHMCHCIASKDHRLICESNNDKATPLFLAALFGHQEAFLCLHFLYEGNPLETWSRKANGDTFLHAALKGEFFGLAYQIIRKYPELANTVNVNGFTPLHILATKPNAFQSGSRLGLFDRIIYRCITVNEVKEIKNDQGAYLNRFQGSKQPWYPSNYETCVQFFHMLFDVVFYLWPLEKIRPSKVCGFQGDEENASNNNQGGKEIGSIDEEEEQEKKPYPPNYSTFIKILKFFINLLLIVLGQGFHRIRKIIVKKERHTMALQVMNELMDKTSLYENTDSDINSDPEYTHSDINFDPRITGAAQGVEAVADQNANFGQYSPSGTKHNEGTLWTLKF